MSEYRAPVRLDPSIATLLRHGASLCEESARLQKSVTRLTAYMNNVSDRSLELIGIMREQGTLPKR